MSHITPLCEDYEQAGKETSLPRVQGPLRMMGGGRNGRFFKWGLVAMLCVALMYMVYLYRDVKSVLKEREDQLESMDRLHIRMTDELKGVSDVSIYKVP